MVVRRRIGPAKQVIRKRATAFPARAGSPDLSAQLDRLRGQVVLVRQANCLTTQERLALEELVRALAKLLAE